MNWRTTGDTTLAVWTQTLKKFNSPMLPYSRETFEAAKGLTRLAKAMLLAESQYGTDYNNNKAENLNPFNLRPRGLGGYQKFSSFVAATNEWKARLLDPKYAYASAKSIDDLVHIYAPGWDNNNVVAYVAKLENDIADSIRLEKFTMPVDTPVKSAKIILNMGHRDTTGGGTEGGGGTLTERGYTDDIVWAIAAKLEAAGHKAYVNQAMDGDTDNSFMNKNLDYVGRNAVWIDSQVGPVDAYLSIHLEGSNAPGCFGIVPDGNGLISAATGQADPGDTWADNPLDVQFARSLATHCSQTTGLQKRSTTEPGVMSERATGVGGDGWRLSEFHETYPIRGHATRNIFEGGAMPNAHDFAIIRQSNFPDLIAQGVLDAVNEVFGTPEPQEPQEPEPPVTHPLPNDEELAVLFGTVRSYNPKGGVSKRWKDWCYLNGQYPPLTQVTTRGNGIVDYIFANYLTIRAVNNSDIYILKTGS